MTESPKSQKTSDTPTSQTEPKRVDARHNADHAAEETVRKARGTKIEETGGPRGLEPTRYGDGEKAGRCIDF